MTMVKISLWRQLTALLKRNIILKRRKWVNLTIELLGPIVITIMLIIMKVSVSVTTYPAIPKHDTHSLYSSPFLGSFSNPKKVMVAPNGTVHKQLMDKVVQNFGLGLGLTQSAGDVYEMFHTEMALIEHYKANMNSYSIAVIFSDDPINNATYKMRVRYGNTPGRDRSFTQPNEVTCHGGSTGLNRNNCPSNQYLFSGFSPLQAALDNALIQVKTGSNNVAMPKINLEMMPRDGHVVDAIWLQGLLAFTMVFVYFPIVMPLANSLVNEKEKKIKDVLKMMGMRDSAYWLSWVTMYYTAMFVLSIIITAMLFAVEIFVNSNFFWVFLIILLSGYAILNFTFFMTTFFHTVKAAMVVYSMTLILMSMLYYAVQIPRLSGTVVPDYASWILSILPPTALAIAIDQAVYIELRVSGGIQTSSLGFTNKIQNFALEYSYLMLLINIILFGLLTAWLDNVLPSVMGKSRSAFFCLDPRFWFSSEAKNRDYSHLLEDADNDVDIEDVPDDLKDKAAVRILNIKKKFEGENKKQKNWCGKNCGATYREDMWAVQGITLDIYEGQITALLGHNGAGKTTLLNMMTGLMNPNYGTATIYGQDVTDEAEFNNIQSMMGVCPQHDILFDELSVWEHLTFVAALKGLTGNVLEKKSLQTLENIDLQSQKHTFSRDLSGGQKRKLSVGLALIGDPQVIFLDEPTAGMDPYSRRKLWTLLKNERKNKTILLTTHFMDEADILADRKAIMSKGRLQCCGSSLYLKNKFGIGYRLNLVIDSDCDKDKVTKLVTSRVRGAVLTRTHGMELTYTLPMSQTESFAGLFAQLEAGNAASTSSLGIKNYGLSMPTLEEVFLKLAEITERDEAEKKELADKDKGETRDVKRINLSSLLDSDSESPSDEDVPRNNSQGSKTHLVMSMQENNGSHVLSVGPPQSQARIQVKILSSHRFWALTTATVKVVSRAGSFVFWRYVMPLAFAIGGVLMMKFLKEGDSNFQNPPVNTKLSDPRLYPYTTQKAPMLYQNSTGDSLFLWLSQLNRSGVDYYEALAGSDLSSVGLHYYGFNVTEMKTQNNYSSQVDAWYNESAVHSVPILINVLSNSIYDIISNNDSDLNNWNIQVTSQDLPELNPPLKFSNRVFNSIRLLGLGFGMLVGFCGFEIVEDREKKIRGQLRVAGLTSTIYWLSKIFIHGVPTTTAVAIGTAFLLGYGPEEYTTPGGVITTLLLMVIYIPLSLLFAYAFSHLFKTAESCATAINLFISLSTLVPYAIVSLVEPQEENIGYVLHYIFCVIFPIYTLLGGLHFSAKLYLTAKLTGQLAKLEVKDYFDFKNHVIGTILIMFVEVFFWYIILRIAEVKSTGGHIRDALCGAPDINAESRGEVNKDRIEDEDSDVKEERNRIQKLQPDKPVVMTKSLRKEYGKRSGGGLCGNKIQGLRNVKVAVRNLSFAVDAGEVFGLLGHNGAGKSTTLSTMTADIAPTKGQVLVAGYDVTSSLSEAFQNLGYCPQHDALYSLMTINEHITLYATLHGMPKQDIPDIADFYIKSLNIEEHKNKIVSELSGGTKRKLSFIISMLGYPRVVLLDEPSTGMDPASKRFLWDTVTACFAGNPQRGAILTTHAMEEADALCTRIGIMVAGELKCLGSTQHLKSKHGGGYTLEVKLTKKSSSADGIQKLSDFMKTAFPIAHQVEQFGDRSIYRIPKNTSVSLSKVFFSLDQAKSTLGIEEYSFSQATLEQVFVEFARLEYDSIEKIKEDSEELPIVV